jgi:hypothetical protein
MKRIPLGVALAVCLLGAAASTASAKTYELGAANDAAAVSCPDNCFVVTRTTALESAPARSDIHDGPEERTDRRLHAAARLLGGRQIHFFNSTYGGTSRVQLAVLREQARPRAATRSSRRPASRSSRSSARPCSSRQN